MDLGERLEIAIANANARGLRIDLGKPIKEYEDYQEHREPPRRRVVGTDGQGRAITIPGVLSAEGRQTRSRRPLGWTHEQLGFAASGMDPLHQSTVLWCLDRDERSKMYVKSELLKLALELKEQARWPARIRRAECAITGLQRCRDRYVEDLCTLAMRQGADPPTYASEAARAEWFGLHESNWRRIGLAAGYSVLSQRVTIWFDDGIRYLKSRLRERSSDSAGAGQMRG